MPRFSIEGPGFDGTEFASESWMTALGDALDRIDDRVDLAGLECEVLDTGDIVAVGPNVRFVVREVKAHPPAGAAPVRPAPRLAASPDAVAALSADALEAPDPGATPAFLAREERSDDILDRIDVASRGITEAPDQAAAANAALDVLMQFVPAESAAVLLPEPPSGDLHFVAARGPRSRNLGGVAIPAGKGIAGVVISRRVALNVREAHRDPHHYGEVDRKSGYDTRALLCVPIRTRTRVGCLQLLNPFGRGDFLTWHLSAAQLVAGRLAATLG